VIKLSSSRWLTNRSHLSGSYCDSSTYQEHCVEAIDQISGASCAPSSIGSPSFVTLSKTGSRGSLTTVFSALERQARGSWHDIVILDKSWFYLNMDHEFIWLQPHQEIPETARLSSVRTVMLAIIWNPIGFDLINILPNGFKFNVCSYVTQILGPLPD
jgi:hypothetical protein